MRPKTQRILLSQALEGFVLAKAAEGRSKHTLADYAGSAKALASWLADNGQGDPDVADITTDTLRRFLAYQQGLRPQRSAKTIKNIHTFLGSFWTWLNQEFGLPHVVKPIKAPKANPPALQLPTREEIQSLLKACDRTRDANTHGRSAFAMRRATGLRDKCIIMVLLDTGLRAQELCALTLQDVDLTSGSILVKHGKGDKQRVVFGGKATRKLLWRYVTLYRKDARSNEPFFLGRGGQPMTTNGLSQLVRKLGRRSGLVVWPHMLRHVFATEFLRGGGSTLALRRLLGHVSDALLARYAEIAEVDLRQAHASASPADRWKL